MNKEEIIRKGYELNAKIVQKNLESRGFEVYFCQDKKSACQKAMDLIPVDSIVSWGGSMTIDEIGLKDEVIKKYKVIDREKATTKEERFELMRQGLLADVFLMSSNAISEDGILVNLDGLGNRVAALCYGPKNVIIVAGMNKVRKNLESARDKVRNQDAPMRGVFYDAETPCSKTGTCADCKSENCICAQLVETRFNRIKGRIKIILVGERLGM